MNNFDQFTNLYSLSKTLRFELKPVGKTRDWMNKNLRYDKNLQTFLADQDIENAYQILKPVFDNIHEKFITKSLKNDYAKKISFTKYFKLKQEQILLNDKYKKVKEKNKQKEPSFTETKNIELELDKKNKEILNEEKNLHNHFATIYKIQGEKFKIEIGNDEKDKPILKENSYKILTEAGILKYIKKNIDEFANLELKTCDGKLVNKRDLEKALVKTDSKNKGVFEGFFTYFEGFNQNRENYYSTEGKTTAVATRIIDENLPKFCDNILAFSKRKDEIIKIDKFLKEKEVSLITKNRDGEESELHKIATNIFEIEYFVNCLSQNEIDKYNIEIGNANNLINKYNQQKNSEQGFKNLPKFKVLYKQIGCGDKKIFIPTIKNDEELKNILNDTVAKSIKYFNNVNVLTNTIITLDNFNGVYWSDKALNIISSKYFANWVSFKELLKNAKIFKKVKDEIKIPRTIELSDLFEIINNYEVEFKETFKDNNEIKQKIVKNNEKKHLKLLQMIFTDIEANKKTFEQYSSWIISDENRKDGFYKKDENTQKIKVFLDSILSTNQILKYFKVRENKIKGTPLNSEVSELLDKILFEENPTNDYDLVRNYLTQKPTVKLNKLKLNFQNALLADGWDANKIENNYCVILQNKDDSKYLAILTQKNKKFFNYEIIDGKGKNKTITKNSLYDIYGNYYYYKMEYKQIATPTGIGGFVRKCFNTAQQYGWICPQDCLNNEGKIIIKNDEAINNLKKIIDCYKDFFNKYEKDGFKYKNYNFIFKDSNKYETLNNFFADVEKQGYKLSFPKYTRINKTILDKAVEDGIIYLFEIKNKDNNLKQKNGDKKESNKNLHTIYWNETFRETQIKPKLNGNAEIFYRPTIKLEKDKDRNGNKIGASHKRFDNEKFIFHCNIQLNYQQSSKWYHSAKEINQAMTKNIKDVCFIGIDRGEKHLAYYSVINQKGEILDQGSFNVIKDEITGKEHDYNAKLEKIAKNRDDARKNWATIGTIKEIKEGYISQVVRKIADLAIKHNAYIVLENLNTGFKRGRQKIEKQIYQKLELALAKKLNFVVDKKAKEGEAGSVQKALQLTPPVTSFSDIDKANQFGIMLYVRANYTSQTDPITGWRKTIYFTKTKQEDIKKEICDKFSDIGFDGKDYYFVCQKNESNIKDWKLWSGKNGISLDRYHGKRNTMGIWKIEKQDIVKLLDEVFSGFDKSISLKNQIDKKLDLSKIATLKYAINLIQQIRNTGTLKGDEDFILSPVRDKNNNHFDSRKSKDIPNGDANGAYNIARKGLMVFVKENGIKEKPQKPDLYIADKDWDKWLQKY